MTATTTATTYVQADQFALRKSSADSVFADFLYVDTDGETLLELAYVGGYDDLAAALADYVAEYAAQA